jgi:radical SAM protein with 4Fe4S-binding SPASM domain
MTAVFPGTVAREIVRRDLYLFEKHGEFFGYGRVSGVFLRFSDSEFARLRDADADLAADDESDALLQRVAQRIASRKIFRQGLGTPRSVQMILTDACNFKCTYCYGMYYDAKPGDRLMPVDVAERLVDFSHALGVRHLGFFGGEPLLNFKAIRATVARAEAIGAQFEYGMTTNGALVTDEIAQYCRDKAIRVSVSLDGPKETHDASRKLKSGQGTFDQVMAGVDRLKRAGRLDMLEATRSSKHPGSVKQAMDFLLEHSDCASCTCVEGRGAACFSDEIVRGDDLVKYYKDMFAVYEERRSRGQSLSIGGIAELVGSLGQDVAVVREHICSALLDRVSVGIDGTIYPCPETMKPQFAICNVKDSGCLDVFTDRRAVVLSMLRKDNLSQHWFSNLTDICAGRISVDKEKRKHIDDAEAIGDALEELLYLVAKSQQTLPAPAPAG